MAGRQHQFLDKGIMHPLLLGDRVVVHPLQIQWVRSRCDDDDDDDDDDGDGDDDRIRAVRESGRPRAVRRTVREGRAEGGAVGNSIHAHPPMKFNG